MGYYSQVSISFIQTYCKLRFQDFAGYLAQNAYAIVFQLSSFTFAPDMHKWNLEVSIAKSYLRYVFGPSDGS